MPSHTGRAQRILGDIWKSQWVETRHRMSWDETCVGGRRLVFACSRRPMWRVPHVLGGGRWKSQNRKIVPLSPYVEESLNSKVIKDFVPEQRSPYVFFEFWDSHVLSLWTLYVHFAYSCIWLWYIYIFGARSRHIGIMAIVRPGYQRDDQAYTGSISRGCLGDARRENTRPPEEGS